MTKVCLRCKITSENAPIHEHHKNGNHSDDRPENKMFLCANCHMTLHWKRWKLSDIGLEDIIIQRKKETETKDDIISDDPEELEQKLTRPDLLNRITELEEENKILLEGISIYHDRSKFDIEEQHYRGLGISTITREEGYPWTIRNKIIKFESEANIHRLEIWQDLNKRFNNFLHDICRYSHIQKIVGQFIEVT